MAFTDENLERLKEDFVIDKDFHANAMWIDRNKFHALLHRLECAEVVLNHIVENGFPKSRRDQVYDYMNAWRKSKRGGRVSEHLENESVCGCGKDKEIDFLQSELSRLKLRNEKLEKVAKAAKAFNKKYTDYENRDFAPLAYALYHLDESVKGKP